MMVLISYDVAVTSPGGKRRLRKIAKECTNFGQRVQYSVFECVIDPGQWARLKNTLEGIIDVELDSLRYYYLGKNYRKRVEHIGAKASFDVDDPLII
ncbi:CRISPR-associated endonuclease Cas2 [Salinispira pacifica]|uniref:CRISPR-associated endoribonuclease Cas2 n=1 Tax=Salinispira pacifica TaxID=1307761 RepID=V5WDY1_9SPIO|nr:CRISPR-associated endonuclease Cas2 [Salinispira pacifica]AHC13997.1 CRISPR-associated protein Cas2 [Salinispira pacifica]